MDKKRMFYELKIKKCEKNEESFPQKAVENKLWMNFSTEDFNRLLITHGV